MDEIDETESIMKGFYEFRMEQAVEDALRADESYRAATERLRKRIREMKEMQLDRSQWLAVDELLSFANEKSAEQGRVSYCQGFIDGIRFFMELQDDYF